MNVTPSRLTRYLFSRTNSTHHPILPTHPRTERIRQQSIRRRLSTSRSTCSSLSRWIGQPALKVFNAGGREEEQRSGLPSSAHDTRVPLNQSTTPDARVSLRPHRSRLVLRSGGFGIPKPHPSASYDTPHPPLPSSSSSFSSSSSSSFSSSSSSSPSSSSTGTPPPTLWPVSSTNPSSLHVSTGGTRAVQVGEDAYFFARSSMGVSDGVAGIKHPNRNSASWEGGWQGGGGRPDTEGGSGKSTANMTTSTITEPPTLRPDSARFSQLLMHFCATEADQRETSLTRRRKTLAIRPPHKIQFESSNLDEGIVPDDKEDELGSGMGMGMGMEPIEIMQKAYEYTVDYARSEGIVGAATCLIAVLDGKKLKIANLGDCALVIVRSGQVVFRIEEMQHGFNYPMALGTRSKEEPMKDAQLSNFEVEKGDIVIMGSDGLSDNLFETEILDVLSTFSSPSSRNPFHSTDPSDLNPSSRVKIAFTPQRVAESLCLAANSASRDMEGYSPFMGKAIDRGYSFVGGKQDDISVLVALIDGI